MGPATYMFLVKILFIQNVYSEYDAKAKEIGLLTFEKYSKNYFIIGEKMEDALEQARKIGEGYTQGQHTYLNSCLENTDPANRSAVSVDYSITSLENLGDADPDMPVFIIKKS